MGLNIMLPFEQSANDYIAGDPKLVTMKYFFTRKVMFVKYAFAFVIMPGGFGTLDECFESLTLVQTNKIYKIPIILFGVDFWSGLLDWLKDKPLAYGTISEEDFDLFLLTDSVDEVVHAMNTHREQKLKLIEEAIRESSMQQKPQY